MSYQLFSPIGRSITASVAGVLLCCAVSAPLLAANTESDAYTALEQGRADEAISLLKPLIAANANNSEAHNLLCRVYYSEGNLDAAVRECQTAVDQSPNSSTYHLWLARALGDKADHASIFSAFGMAKQVARNFELAVKLDPNNVDALTDLGEFYLEAPGIVGGGVDKAQQVASQLEGKNASRAHWLKARLAEHNKDFSTAEAEYKKAIEAGSNVPEAWVNLAGFYRKQNKFDAAEEAVRNAIKADSKHDAVLVDAASVLQRMNREPELAIHALQLYLDSPNKSESAPAFRVHVTLGKLLRQKGDIAGAQKEFAAALALAHDYVPAKKAESN
ncbi:MAG: tetratricopeptide repeat protein [Acidobacteriaceae bacterium]